MKQRNNKIKINIWIYLLIFSFLLLLFLWIFQFLIFHFYYETGVRNNISKVVDKVTNYNYLDDNKYLENLAYQNNVCIEIVDVFNNVKELSSKNCLIEGQSYDKYKLEFINSGKNSSSSKIINALYNNKIIVKAIKSNNKYIFISGSLEISSSVINIFVFMFVLSSIIVLMLSLLLGYIISNKISKPIISITNKAKMLKLGKYDIDFNNRDSIYEISLLEDTLNDTAKILSQTENLRREFLANVSHDLKTPLTMIKAYAEMIRDITYDNKEKTNENLKVIIDETERLNLLVCDLLELSNLQSCGIIDEKSLLDLNEIVKEILTRYDINRKEGFVFIYKENKNMKVMANKKRIEQIIYNLVNNAITYTGKNKKIYIELIDNKKYITLKVKDTGKGINKQEINNIWQKYYKVDKSHKRDSVGSGIGLSIVKSICDNNNYEYGVISKENKGSIFYINITK